MTAAYIYGNEIMSKLEVFVNGTFAWYCSVMASFNILFHTFTEAGLSLISGLQVGPALSLDDDYDALLLAHW